MHRIKDQRSCGWNYSIFINNKYFRYRKQTFKYSFPHIHITVSDPHRNPQDEIALLNAFSSYVHLLYYFSVFLHLLLNSLFAYSECRNWNASA